MPYSNRKTQRPSRSKGRREAKAAEMAARPGMVLEAIWQEPLTAKQICALCGFSPNAKSKSTCYLTAALKRSNQARDVQIGNVRLWVANGSPAEAEALRLQAEHQRKRLDAETARAKARWTKRAAAIHADSWSDQPPKHVLKAAGEWVPKVPPRAVRSVFELGAMV